MRTRTPGIRPKLFSALLACGVGAVLLPQSAGADCVDTGGYTTPSGVINCTGVSGGLGQITDNYHLVDFVDVTVHDGAFLTALGMYGDHDGHLVNNGGMGGTSIIESEQVFGGGQSTGFVTFVPGLISDVPGLAEEIEANQWLKYGLTPISIIGDWDIENHGLIVYEAESLVSQRGAPLSGAGSGIELLGRGTIVNTGRIVTTSDLAEGIFTIPLGTIWNTETGSIETGGYRSDGIATVGVPDAEGSTFGAIVNDGAIRTTGDRSAGINLLWQGDILNNGEIDASGVRSAGIRMTGGSFGQFFMQKIDDRAWAFFEQQFGPSPTLQQILQHYQSTGVEIPSSWFLLPDEQYATGTITNNGSITVTGDTTEGPAHGAVILGTQNGMITNGGSVEVTGQDAIGLGLFGQGTITNEASGTIHASGVEAEGISAEAFEDTDVISISNSGAITVEGDEWAVGIGVTADDARISMGGAPASISATGKYATGIEALGDRVRILATATADIDVTGDDSVGIWVTGDDAAITLARSSIRAEGSNADGIGVYGDRVVISTNPLAVIDVSGTNSEGIAMEGDWTDVVNQGRISTSGLGGQGVLIVGDGCQGVVGDCATVNEGSIRTSGNFSEAIAVIGHNQRVQNSGSISTWGRDSAGIALGEELAGLSAFGAVLNQGAIETNGVRAHGVLAVGEGHTLINSVSGTISTASGDSHGLALGLSGQLFRSRGQIWNDGVIETTGFGADGIHTFADDSGVTNRNSIRTTAPNAAGIRTMGDRFEITNGTPLTGGGAATIATDGDSAHGIFAQGRDVTVRNHGSIETFSQDANAILVSGATRAEVSNLGSGILHTHGDRAYGVRVTGNDVKTVNGGEVATEGAAAHGIFVEGDATSGAPNVTNTNRIATSGAASNGINLSGNGLVVTNTGLITTAGPISHGVATSGDRISVINSGNIVAGKTLSRAIHLDTVSGQTASLVNSGTLSATQSNEAVVGGGGSDRVQNSGTVLGQIFLRGGDDILELSGAKSYISAFSDGGSLDEVEGDHLIWSAPNFDQPLYGGSFRDFEILTSRSVVELTGPFETEEANLIGGEIIVDGHFTASELRMNKGFMTLSPGSLLTVDFADIAGGPAGDECGLGTCLLLDNATVNSSDGSGIAFIGVGGSLAGTGTVEIETINDGGYIAPGFSPGLLTIDGDLLFNDGLLEIEIGGTGIGEFDVLEVTGVAEFLGGEVLFSFIDDFLPSPDDFFDFLIADTILGLENLSFGLFGLPSDYGFDLFHNSGGLQVAFDTTTSVPEPGSLLLFVTGLGALVLVSRRPRRARRVGDAASPSQAVSRIP